MPALTTWTNEGYTSSSSSDFRLCHLDLQLTFGPGGRRVVGAIIWTHLLDQPVVRAVEGHVDTDDPEGLGAHPGDQALGLLLRTGLRRVVVAQHHLPVALRSLVVHPAVEGLGVFGVEHALTLQVKLHFFPRRDKTDGHVARACGVVTEVEPESPVPMVHYLTHDQQV